MSSEDNDSDLDEVTTREEKDHPQQQRDSKEKMDTMEDKVLELEAEVRRLHMENAELRNKIKTEEPYDKIYNERQDLMEQHGFKDMRIKELESHQKSLNENIEEYLSGKTRLDGENKTLKAELVAVELRERSLNNECEDLKIQIDILVKQNGEFGEELDKLKADFERTKDEKDDLVKEIEENKQKEAQKNMMYIEELRANLREQKTKCDAMVLETEALKSENESLFRANESKKDEIKDIQKEAFAVRRDFQLEKLRYTKLKQEWEDDRSRTEFVLVSKDKRKRDKTNTLAPFKEETDSEDEHVVSIVEAANAEREELKAKEIELKTKVNQLQTDKEELFRSGTSLFAENKALKNDYDNALGERTMLLQVESALKRKVRDQENEIKNLKNKIDELYDHNISMQNKEEKENKTQAYVVLRGNEMIKQLERDKSTLHRRVKYLEKENNEIESRVIDLERQSKQLVDYTNTYDQQSPLTDDKQPEQNYRRENVSRNNKSSSRSARIAVDLALVTRRTNDYRMPSGKDQFAYRDLSRMSSYRGAKSPDYFKTNEPPLQRVPSRQPSFGPQSVRSIKSHDSRLSLPRIHKDNISEQFR